MKYQRFLRRKVRNSVEGFGVGAMSNVPNFVFIWKSVDNFGEKVGLLVKHAERKILSFVKLSQPQKSGICNSLHFRRLFCNAP